MLTAWTDAHFAVLCAVIAGSLSLVPASVGAEVNATSTPAAYSTLGLDVDRNPPGDPGAASPAMEEGALVERVESDSEVPGLTPLSPKMRTFLARNTQLIHAGAQALALAELDAHYPGNSASEDWRQWARHKWNLLIERQDWSALDESTRTIPQDLPESIKLDASIYQARAKMELGKVAEASVRLREVLTSPALLSGTEKAARQLLIDIYLKQGDFANARIEADRYHQEFKPQETGWFTRRAVIALRAGQYEEAATLLAPIASPEARLLSSYAYFKAGAMSPEQLKVRASKALQKRHINPGVRRFGQALLVSAARGQGGDAELAQQVGALETYLLNSASNAYGYLVDYDVTELANVYRRYGEQLANANQLLTGDTHAWLELSRSLEETAPAEAVAVVVAALSSARGELKGVVKNQVIQLLGARNMAALTLKLFGEAGPLGDYGGVSQVMLSQLVNYGLSTSQSDFVAELAGYFETDSDVELALQNARIQIFIGHFGKARQQVNRWLDAHESLDGPQIDHVLQLVFDLQEIDQHSLALELLENIRTRNTSTKHKREMLYWSAQSLAAQEHYAQAASAYLLSAMASANGFDDWGQSARYHAAQMLVKMREFDDAERLLRGVLSVAQNSSRQQAVRQALQQLWLLKQAGE